MIDLTDTTAIYARAREAYANGELQAQKDNPGDVCQYAGPCGIGVYLSDEDRHYLDNPGSGYSTDIQELLHEKIVTGDEFALGDLQAAHDNWATCKMFNASPEDIAQAEADFAQVLERY